MKVNFNKQTFNGTTVSRCSYERLIKEAGEILFGTKEYEEIVSLDVKEDGIYAHFEYKNKKERK